MTKNSKAGVYVQRTTRVQFGMVDAAVIRDESLPANVKTVYTYLVTYCSDQRSAYPSRARIAKQTGLSVRTVDAAIKRAEQVGLMTVTRRRDGKVNLTNLYELHDFGGGYIAGSGAAVAPGVAQDVREGGAGVAPELNHVSRPSSTETTSTSSDSSPPEWLGHAASARPPIKIFGLSPIPDDMDDGELTRRLVASSIAALQAAGLEPSWDCADRLGRVIKNNLRDRGIPRYEIVHRLEVTLSRAGTNDPEWGWLATPIDQSPGAETRVA